MSFTASATIIAMSVFEFSEPGNTCICFYMAHIKLATATSLPDFYVAAFVSNTGPNNSSELEATLPSSLPCMSDRH